MAKGVEPMEAPRSRYRVEERDGRLVVIDNGTGAPIPKGIAAPPFARGNSASPAPVVHGKGAVDAIADFLLALAVKEWDGEGRAVIAWEWQQNGKTKRWDALLDADQQRRLGRAFLALFAAPVALLILLLAGGEFLLVGLVPALAASAWAFARIYSLQSETQG
jgi:hypothetical protein